MVFTLHTFSLFLTFSLSIIKMKPNSFLNSLLFLTFYTHLATSITHHHHHHPTNDSTALLSFKSKSDLGNNLRFSPNTSFGYCKWQGVICRQARVVRLVLEGLSLGGIFGPNSLTRLDQLRVLSLQNNSLTGSIPDLSGLINLKALFLDHNSFTGPIPNSITTLHRIRTIDLSFNTFTGSIPPSLNNLDRLYCLRLESNQLNGSIPPLNQTSLLLLNVSGNNLTGAIPVTQTLSRFSTASFSFNPGLCGEIVNRECHPRVPFFVASPPVSLGQNQQLEQGVNCLTQQNHKRTALIVGLTSGVFVLVGSIIFLAMALKKHSRNQRGLTPIVASDSSTAANAAAVMRIKEEERELEEKVKKVQVAKSGSLVFCASESQIYSLDQLMRASAELLGKGTVGTTYKAVLDNRLILTVKRLDAGKLAGTSREVFERCMESVGGLRHPNLVPLRAYFQAKEERLLVYDYQPNGSLFSLIHGTKSARAKPLHWTSCLKIAEDVAQGLSYIHQAWRLVHGNLKSSNVLLGPDFEACLTDYSLSLLTSYDSTTATTAYRAPETRKSSSNHHREPTSKSDVYAYGVLLLELLTGKPPPENLCLIPDDVINWVRSGREDHDGGEDHRLEMLLEVAMGCSVVSQEQRPTMWQVLKMIQEIKEAVIMDDCELVVDPLTGTS